jgi:hypothetical protein
MRAAFQYNLKRRPFFRPLHSAGHRIGKSDGEFPLKYSGQKSQFQTSLPVSEKGTYELILYSYDPENGNTGLDRASFTIR